MKVRPPADVRLNNVGHFALINDKQKSFDKYKKPNFFCAKCNIRAFIS